jgi:hypothetical protein
MGRLLSHPGAVDVEQRDSVGISQAKQCQAVIRVETGREKSKVECQFSHDMTKTYCAIFATKMARFVSEELVAELHTLICNRKTLRETWWRKHFARAF